MSEDSNFKKDQKKEEERSVVLDFSGSLGKGMLAKEKIETLDNSSGLTPLSFDGNVRNKIKDRENNELQRTETDSGSVSSYRVGTSSFLNSSDQYAQNTKIFINLPGLTTLHPFDEICSIQKKSVSLIEGFSDKGGFETLENSSGLTPLNLDREPQIKAPRVTTLESVSAYPQQGIRERGVEKPQGFDNGKRRNSTQRTLRMQSSLKNFADQGE
jgi:hypothetical protein